MATNSNNTIRLRLYFDYPPPAVSDQRMCWLLVDLNKCRVVADLESVIRDKFDISRKSILNLFIDNCYLPHTESVYVVRDNDHISVNINIDSQVLTNGHSSDQVERQSSKKSRKHSHVDPEGNDILLECKKKKRKKMTEGSLNGESRKSLDTIRDEGSQNKHLKKKKRKEKTPKPLTPKAPLTSKAPLTPSGQHINKTPRPKPVDINGRAKAKQVSSSDSSDDSSEEDTAAPNLTSKVQKTLPTEVPVAPTPPMVPLKSKPVTAKKSPPVSSSVKAQGETASKPSAVPPSSSSDSDSDSEEEIKLVIKRPLPAREGVAVEACMSARGRGRGRAQPPGRSGVTSGNLGGRVGRGFHLNYDEEEQRRARPPLYEKDSLRNHSVMLQNAVEPPPKKDYSTMPLLAAPPGVGQKIAFKLLELTENYTPEVSEYKEGEILHFDHTTKQVELQLLNSWQAPAEPGKFDLVYQNADGSESVEYAVARSGSRVTEHWDSLLEPRLVL